MTMRNGCEYQVLVRLADLLPAHLQFHIVAARGFGEGELYQVLTAELKLGFVVRFREEIAIRATSGKSARSSPFSRRRCGARTLRRRHSHRQGVCGYRHTGLRAGEGHERAVYPCGEHHRRSPPQALIKLSAKHSEIEGFVSTTQRIYESASGSIDQSGRRADDDSLSLIRCLHSGYLLQALPRRRRKTASATISISRPQHVQTAQPFTVPVRAEHA